MAKALDSLSVLLLAGAAVAFALGVSAISDQHDLLALYWLVVGALLLRSASDLARPRAG